MVGPVRADRLARSAFLPAAASKAIVALACVAAMPIAKVRAAELRDPTRPPPAMRASPAEPAAAASAAPAPQLQSILIGAGRKPSAIIDGRVVELGDTFDKMRLTRLTETHAVLTGAAGQARLELTPGATKQSTATTAVAAIGPDATVKGAAKPATLTFRVAEQK